MTTIQFAKNPAALAKASAVLVVAPAKRFTTKAFPKVFDAPVRAKIIALAADLEPGDAGDVSRTLTDGAPATIHVGVLPDEVSRYNSPARAAAIRNVVEKSGIGSVKDAGVLLVLDDAEHFLAAANAIGRALPEFARKSAKRARRKVTVAAVDRKGTALAANATLRATVEAARLAARLVDTPPTDLDPAGYAREIRAALRGVAGVTIKEIKGNALLDARLGGIHGVGRCAVSPPRLIVARYKPAGSAKAKGRHVALVGKGITYDTGGLHIKGRGGMEGMKADMGGSAAVLGAFKVLAQTKAVDFPVTLVMCIAENAIGPVAYKPDDILTMHSGKTVEINNTDAEGRLLLADGVSYAARVLGTDTIIDAATLTGAQLIATGINHAAVVSNDDKLERTALDAGKRSGDLCHALPFAPEFYKQEFASPVADMRNSVKNRSNAQSSCAAEFVHWHIEDTPAKWLHIDLAGPAFPFDRATGYGVALVAEIVRSL